MVGPWPLAPHHDHLQYIHHIHLMQRGQNWGITRCVIQGEFSSIKDNYHYSTTLYHNFQTTATYPNDGLLELLALVIMITLAENKYQIH